MFKNLLVRKAYLVDIELADGSTTYALTNWFQDDGTYVVDGFDISTIENSSDVPNLEVLNITNTSIRTKAIDGFMIKATVTVTLKDMDSEETYILFKGQVQRVTIQDYWIDLDCQGFMALCEQNLNKTYTKECLNDLGDTNCGVILTTYTDSGTVTTVNSRSSFVDTSLSQADNYYQYGKVTFTSGSNNGISREVLQYDSSTDTVVMFIPFPYDIEVGDTYDIYRGCQKDKDDCTNVFDNWPNFRGYAHLTPADEDLKWIAEDDEDDIDEDDDLEDDEEVL